MSERVQAWRYRLWQRKKQRDQQRRLNREARQRRRRRDAAAWRNTEWERRPVTPSQTDRQPHPPLLSPSAQKGTPDLAASAPDRAADAAGTTHSSAGGDQ